jgi:SAM-dependent methyltransferase
VQAFRARGRTFGAVALSYAAFRPGYPDAAVDWALEPLGGRPRNPAVLDLGAGTGKLTAALAARSDRVSAVEPDEDMLGILRTALPGVRALAGSAERIPLPDASVDAVLVGQAFHWFDPAVAGAEIGRVLRPGGVLGALWNAEDAGVDWVDGYHHAAFGRSRGTGVPAGADRESLPGEPWFGPTERREFGHHQRLTVDGLIDVLGTHSWALVAESGERDRAFDAVRDYFAARPELTDAPDGAFDLPLRTMVFRALRLADRDAERR